MPAQPPSPHQTPIPEQMPAIPPPRSTWWRDWRVMLPVWLVMLGLTALAAHYQVDSRVIAAGLFVVGLVSNAFAWLLGLIALVPLVGPLVVKVLSMGFIWLLNAVGYLVSFIAIRRGYSRDVLTYRGLTVAVIIGIVIGYVLGKLF